ncbi:MAG: 4Fe-4S binding protein, partial [Acholeplasmataceae bacterium]|nr:4Fe-4S binding protein [Acholeplasmataceae bacterium]
QVNKCIECGLCSFVCPSKIHLTEYMRLGKRYASK